MTNRHIVCLTFDFDAISGFIARGAARRSRWQSPPASARKRPCRVPGSDCVN